jgi:hypothetical protein
MRNFTLFCLLIICQILASSSASAQSKRYTIPGNPPGTAKKLVSSDTESSIVKFTLGDFNLSEIRVNGQPAVIPELEGATPILKKAAPELLKLTASVIIPDGVKMGTKVISSSFVEYKNVLIAPSKGNLKRSQDLKNTPYTFGEDYQANKFFPGHLTELREPYILRGHTGQTIVVYPFQYNPVTKTLRVYSEITIEVKAKNKPQKIASAKDKKYQSREFENVYKNHFLNAAASNSRYTPVEEGDKMLIISHGPFMQSMEPFIEWKRQRGIEVEMVDIATIGVNANAIKNYVATYFHTKGLSYLLLVGDAAQVPTLSLPSGHSDIAFGYILGADAYPEIFVGRFSAETTTHVATQVQRVLEYEKNPSGTWYKTALAIASEEGPGYKNLMDYEHLRNIQNQQLLPFTYNNGLEMFEGAKGGNDAAGDPNATMVKNALETGIGVINYTGHGSDNSWGTTGYNNTNINALSNTGKLPFIWSVACVNGNFVGQTCFGEAWMRAAKNGQPVGAIGAFMATINQSWVPPMSAQEEFNKILSETYTTNIKRTFGGISFNGCMRMNDEFGPDGTEMTDTWVLFGDPSLEVRTDAPSAMSVSHQPTAVVGISNITVSSNTEGATVALSYKGELIGKGKITGGVANISFNPITTIDTIKVTVTGFNKTPYFGNILIISPNGPYVLNTDFTIKDAQGNNNGKADYSEEVFLDFTLKNFGNMDAQNIVATITSSNSFITILSGSANWGGILANSSAMKANAFKIKIADNVPDGHIALFNIQISDGSANTWQSQFSIKLNAPALSSASFLVKDPTGNNNGRLDKGENAVIEIPVNNLGNSATIAAQGTLTTNSPSITIQNPTISLSIISEGQFTNAAFNIKVSENTPVGEIAEFTFHTVAGAYNCQFTFKARLNQNVEDFESNSFSQNNWQFAGTKPWIISTEAPFEGLHCSKSGTITDSEKSEMKITIDVENNDSIIFYRRVSSEEGYDFLKFYINNVLKGEWAGNLPWTRQAYAVTPGIKTFRWVYEKDFMISSYDDCAYVDEIILPAEKPDYTSISEQAKTLIDFLVYPNPAKATVNIHFTDKGGESSVSIMNMAGQIMLERPMNNLTSAINKFTIDTAHLTPGMYFITLRNGGFAETRKLTIMR